MGRLPTADDLGFNHPSAGLAVIKQPESGLAEGLQTLGRTIAAIGLRERAEQEQLSKYKLKSDLENFQWDQKIAYQQVVDTSAEDGSDIWARREAELQKVKKDWDKRPMSPEERAMVDDVFNGVMGQQRFAAYEDARTKRFAWQEKDIKWGAERTLSQGLPDQETFDAWWNAQVAKIDSSGLPIEMKNKIKAEIATAGALKFGSDNPQAFIGSQRQGQGGAQGGDAPSLIRKFEGFRENPYYDVNAYRAGYGSDTVTMADGRILRIRPGMKVSRDDAERDLARRSAIFADDARKAVGDRAWGALNDNQQAALTSIAYNYGSLPKSVVEAVKSGSVENIATSVEGLKSHNGGINAKRRQEEANIIRGVEVSGQESPTFVSGRKPTGGMWDYVSLDDWEKIHKVAAGVAKDNILSTAPDELTALELNGKFDGKALTADDFNAAYGPEAAEKYADYNTQRSQAEQKYEYGSMTEAQILADLEARKNAIPTGTGIAEASKNYSEMVTAASSVIAERYKDPAKYVMDRNPDVRASWDAFDPKDPSTGKSAIAATIAAQQALGIPANKIMPMPKATAAMVSEIVKDDIAKPSDRMNTLIAMVSQTDDSVQQEAILRQLVDSGLTPAIANVMEAWQRHDEGAARRLFAAATVDTEKMPKPAGLKEKEFSDAVTEALMGEGTAGYYLYGLKYGDPRGQKVAQSDLALAKNAALISMRGGMDQSQAVAQAVRDIMGDVRVIEEEFDGGGAVEGVVPNDVNQDSLKAGMAASMDRVMLAVQAYNARQTAALPEGTSKETEAIFRARTVMRESDILTEGSFRNYGNGWGFYDPYTNAFVVGPDGKALVFTTDELLRAGAAQPGAGTFQTPRTKAIEGIEQ